MADLARAERIEAQLSLLALLRRRIVVSKLTLEGPNILFEFVGGKPNWVLEPAADSQTSLAGSHVTLDIRQAHVLTDRSSVAAGFYRSGLGDRDSEPWRALSV